MKKLSPIYKWALLVFALIIVFFSYIKAEYLTFKYGDEFLGLESQTNMLNDSRYYRVIDYWGDEATVFYVSDSGDIIRFVKNDKDEWELQEWKTIWSKTGSASEFHWPYYR